MKKKSFIISISILATFITWTLLIRFIDVKPIGPFGSSVGFATLNGFVHRMIGVHLSLYVITDWLGLIPIITALGFAILGLTQWIRRKKLHKVDQSILVLGGFYVLVMALYLFFEFLIINYRPILINESLEASYPSSTTMLVLCIMPTAAMQLRARLKSNGFKCLILIAIRFFTAFMVIGRLLSGVHWLTDIIGSIILSIGLLSLYHGCCKNKEKSV